MTKQEAIKYLQQLYPNGGHCWLDEQRIDAIDMAIKALQEEPVSEDLEYASEKYACRFSSSKYGHDKVKDSFIAGAEWQKEQFEKNRLAHCDEITAEQAIIESGFVVQHFAKYNRTPTFMDAIEYGMRLQRKKKCRIKNVQETVNSSCQ